MESRVNSIAVNGPVFQSCNRLRQTASCTVLLLYHTEKLYL